MTKTQRSVKCCASMGLVSLAMALATNLHAQTINIDYASAAATPNPAYAGAAAQPGIWNALVGGVGATLPQPLVDTGGFATAATIAIDTARPEYHSNNPLTFGGDEALMDDALDLGGLLDKTRIEVDGLTPGFYDIYVYAWAPDNDLFRTGVTFLGWSGETSVGGLWTGAHAPGTTYALGTIFTAGGAGPDLTILARTLAGFGSLNGLQIVPVPSPATGSVLLAAAVAFGSRRRRT